MDEINIEDFIKLDLRIAKVICAEAVEEADKLLKLELDVGSYGKKIVFAGMKKSYDADTLINKLVVCVNNLKPRKMRFGTSEGMILAAGDDDLGIFILSPDEGAEPGMQVR
jgi:methionyl-tRNA synthetase